MVRKLSSYMNWEQICRHYAKQLVNVMPETEKERFVRWMITTEAVNSGDPIAGSKIYYYAYRVYKRFSEEQDTMTAIVGPTGLGKSWCAAAIGALVSPNFSLKNILFNPVDMLDAFLNAKRGDTIMIDEGALFLFSREALSKNNKMATKIFSISRVLGLHVLICLPEFKHLDTGVRYDRIHSLIYMKDKGCPRIYSKSGIKIVNEVYPKKKSDIIKVRVPSAYWFDGRTRKSFPSINDLSEEAYLRHKVANVRKTLKDMRKELSKDAKISYNALDEVALDEA